MTAMSRGAVALIVIALAAGLGLGLYIGWVAAPVKYVDTAPNSLQRAFKDDYILMIATAYAGDGDLAAARAHLATLGFTDPAAAVTAAAQRLSAAGLPATDQQRLSALAQALRAPPLPSPTPAAPSETPNTVTVTPASS
jgi:hypothetical protein